MFDALLAPPSLFQDVSTRSFSSLVEATPANATAFNRGRFHTVSLTGYSEKILDVIVGEMQVSVEPLVFACLALLTTNVALG